MTLFNIHFPVTLTRDSIHVLAEGDLDGCGYVIFLVGKEHGEQSSYPAHPMLSEWGGHNGTLSFLVLWIVGSGTISHFQLHSCSDCHNVGVTVTGSSLCSSIDDRHISQTSAQTDLFSFHWFIKR